jgi:hypothetical protein
VLRNEYEIFAYPQRFFDKDGKDTWVEIREIVKNLEPPAA